MKLLKKLIKQITNKLVGVQCKDHGNLGVGGEKIKGSLVTFNDFINKKITELDRCYLMIEYLMGNIQHYNYSERCEFLLYIDEWFFVKELNQPSYKKRILYKEHKEK